MFQILSTFYPGTVNFLGYIGSKKDRGIEITYLQASY